MTPEPDRPRRDVSIEEAQRMPMSEEELAEIERNTLAGHLYHSDTLALVAEVRRLRADNERLNAEVQLGRPEAALPPLRDWDLLGDDTP